MSTMKGPTVGGSGGKRGHSNMEHWVYSEELKESSKIRRRNNAKKEIRNEIKNVSRSDSGSST